MDRLRELSRILVDDAAFAACTGRYADQRALWDLAVRHSVHLLLAWRIAEDKAGHWHPRWRTAGREALAHASVLEELQRRELARLTAAFADHAIPALLLKGAAWAYTLYPRPLLRPRSDTDVLLAASSRDRAERLLSCLGYEPAVENVMELASGQRHYHRVDEQQVGHPLDLHWRVTNPLVFADALPFDGLWERSVSLSIPGARTLCAVDGLQLACLHRLAHHGHESDLLWLLDIHLLAEALSAAEWNDLMVEADTGRLREVCAKSLSLAEECFGTSVPSRVSAWLDAGGSVPPEAVFLGRGVDPLGVLASDWRAVGTWSGRLRLLRDHVCPPPSYMRARYGSDRPIVLPILYVYRLLSGLPRWLAGR